LGGGGAGYRATFFLLTNKIEIHIIENVLNLIYLESILPLTLIKTAKGKSALVEFKRKLL
jgi:hypothetical protein